MLLIFSQIIIFLLFFKLIFGLVAKEKVLDLFIVFLAILSVTIGESMNLFVFKMAVYNGVEGIPTYIILGGALVSWGIYKFARRISEKYHIECVFCRIAIVFGISLFLPIIELLGLETELWYWRRPFSICSVAWFLGVWKFYFIFVTTPAIIGIILNMFTTNLNCSCKIHSSSH